MCLSHPAICQILVTVFCAALIIESNCDPYSSELCNYYDNLEWNLIPIYSQFFRLESHLTPYVKADWAFYISILGVLVNIGEFYKLFETPVQSNLCKITTCSVSAHYRSVSVREYHQFLNLNLHEPSLDLFLCAWLFFCRLLFQS